MGQVSTFNLTMSSSKCSLTLLIIIAAVSCEESRFARLIAAVPGTEAHFYRESRYSGEGGSGFNPGYSNSVGGGTGYNPGVSGGSGFNPGYNGGGGYNPGVGGTVAFSARRADTCCRRSRSRVVFDQSITNLGGGWDAGRGEFTAPHSGTYSFSWSALSPDHSQLRLGLMHNSQEMSSSWADSEGYQSSSGSTVLTLRRGDVVGLEVTDGEIYEPGSSSRGYTMFSGYRVG